MEGTTEQANPTEQLYFTYPGNFILENDATVLFCQETDSSSTILHLDRSCMHPQGGGQPSDVGTIQRLSPPASASVQAVTLDRSTGIVHHRVSAPFLPGDRVRVSVDADRRLLLSECHTAGHVVDAAMARVGKTLPPSKGYHFLDGPYVEYRGAVPPAERADLLAQLKVAFRDLVEEDIMTEIETMEKGCAEEVCNRLAQNFDLSLYGEEVRVVTVAGWPCPCGGTHVRSTKGLEKRGWGVTGLKCKKKVVRVKYGMGN